MFRLGIILVIIGCGCGYFAYQEWSLASSASAAPQEIKLKDLITRGPEGNPNVVITDFVISDNLVYETQGSKRVWTRVWLPILPRNEMVIVPGQPVQHPPNSIKAVLFSLNVRNEAELEQLERRPRLPVLVTNKITSLSGKEKKLLMESYPGADFDRCLILHEGREPASPLKLLLLSGGGGAALLAGLGILVVGKLGQMRRG